MSAMIRNPRGIALPVAIFALVIVGALVTGAFFIGFQEQTVGRNTLKVQQAFAAAEAGADMQVMNWNPTANNQLAVDSTSTFAGTIPNNAGWYRGSITRLNDLLFLVRSEGFSRDSAARQQVGLLVRLRPLEIDIQGALSTQGATRIGGSSFIEGHDNVPGSWTGCPALAPSLPALRIKDSTVVTYSSCPNQSCLDGVPKIEQDPTISDSTLTTFGDVQFNDLRGMATKILSGGTVKIEPTLTNGACNTASLTNWGDPLNPTAPCGNFFPIVWSDGNLSINGVQGQGILIVDGDLSVQGNFQFFGPVIVKKSLKTTGTGGHFQGGVIAANVDLAQNTVLGNAVIEYSSCALIRAMRNTAPGALLRDRSWVNLY